jgi:hypothetical protein
MNSWNFFNEITRIAFECKSTLFKKLEQNLEKFFFQIKKVMKLFLSLTQTQRIISYKVFSFSKKLKQ